MSPCDCEAFKNLIELSQRDKDTLSCTWAQIKAGTFPFCKTSICKCDSSAHPGDSVYPYDHQGLLLRTSLEAGSSPLGVPSSLAEVSGAVR